jgi:hypothetical protein
MSGRRAKFNLMKSIFYGIAIIAVYFCLLGVRGMKEVRDEYLILTKEKIVTKGQITHAEEFEEEIERNQGRNTEIVNGYTYKYEFLTLEGKKLENLSGNYGELPLNKNLNDIPYVVEIEYIKENPKINRIIGILDNNTDIFDWFRRNVLEKLLLLLLFLFFSSYIIKAGIADYRKNTL